jgi:cardiolipin synthase
MAEDFSVAIERLVKMAPEDWVTVACVALRNFPPSARTEFVFLMTELARLAAEKMSWEALGWALSTACAMHYRWQSTQQIELLWGGPLPADRIPVRRIDQALYDLIANAKREILLVTFAAAKVERLADELLKAVQRDVHIRLTLEFEHTSRRATEL